MAAFCLATGVSITEYKQLYPYEVDAFIKRFNEVNKTK